MQAKKQKIRAELDNHRAARDAMVKQQREMRTKCEYMSVEQVDEAITRLESRMAHTSMSLQDEKKAMEDIKRLKVCSKQVLATIPCPCAGTASHPSPVQ